MLMAAYLLAFMPTDFSKHNTIFFFILYLMISSGLELYCTEYAL